MQENGRKNAKDCLFCLFYHADMGVESGFRAMDYLDKLTISNDKRCDNLYNLTFIE